MQLILLAIYRHHEATHETQIKTAEFGFVKDYRYYMLMAILVTSAGSALMVFADECRARCHAV